MQLSLLPPRSALYIYTYMLYNLVEVQLCLLIICKEFKIQTFLTSAPKNSLLVRELPINYDCKKTIWAVCDNGQRQNYSIVINAETVDEAFFLKISQRTPITQTHKMFFLFSSQSNSSWVFWCDENNFVKNHAMAQFLAHTRITNTHKYIRFLLNRYPFFGLLEGFLIANFNAKVN